MGRRKRHEDDPGVIRRKIRRLEKRLQRQREHKSSDEDDESDHSRPASLPSDYESSEHYQSDGTQSNFRSVVTVPQHTIFDTITGGDETSAAPEILEALPSDILEVLGESREKDEVFGPKIREEISKRWGKIIMEGLGKEQKQKLFHITSHHQPINVPTTGTQASSL